MARPRRNSNKKVITVETGEAPFAYGLEPGEAPINKVGEIYLCVEFIDANGDLLNIRAAHGFFALPHWTAHRTAHFAIRTTACAFVDPKRFSYARLQPQMPREVFERGWKIVDCWGFPIPPDTKVGPYRGETIYIQLPFKAPFDVRYTERKQVDFWLGEGDIPPSEREA